MKNFKKMQIATAVMIATAGIAASTAQADSLLAPLIINTSAFEAPYGGPFTTYLNVKVKGKNGNDLLGNPQDGLHYVWIKKGSAVSDLYNLDTPCTMINNSGRVTKNDMIHQSTTGGISNSLLPNGMPQVDNSVTNTYNADFVGMLVLSDSVNESNAGSSAPEGDMSGFAYIADAATGGVLSYKLLNNHHSAEDGNFSAGFISKKVVDFSWMSSNKPDGVATGWTAMVTGPDMSKHSAPYTSSYDATVSFSQVTHPDGTQSDPKAVSNGVAGVFDADEGFTSYDPNLKVTCMGSFTRSNLLGGDPVLLANTANGGWMRMTVAPTTKTVGGVKVATNHAAKGAIVYRSDVILDAAGVPTAVTMDVETGGHLAIGHEHANRPY